jgi:hypothetical protein
MGAIQCCQTCGALLSGGDGPCVRCGTGAPVAAAPRVSSSRGFTVIPVNVAKAHHARSNPAQVLHRPLSVPPVAAPASHPHRTTSSPVLPTARARAWLGRLFRRS